MWEDLWCIGGDFNVLRFPRERNREGRWTGAMRRFSQIIDELDLKDMPLQGGVLTWTGGPGKQRIARLDRFLITDDWENYFGNVTQCTLPRPLSDHFPILLTGGGSLVHDLTPFRFENMWLKTEGFKSLIDGCSLQRFAKPSLHGKVLELEKSENGFGWWLLFVYFGRCGMKGTGRLLIMRFPPLSG